MGQEERDFRLEAVTSIFHDSKWLRPFPEHLRINVSHQLGHARHDESNQEGRHAQQCLVAATIWLRLPRFEHVHNPKRTTKTAKLLSTLVVREENIFLLLWLQIIASEI